ncbi:MAG: EamA family transporter [Gammaproteobacteria bacterium]|nr:EamA family transporter [Gammaproteobacteria bacterium]NIM72172.1 EamA family transporter [Gammaproteobacteria bacterium]NIN39087.1 EamA family transporter [Gammaproteobacteria bacterium]NIO23920.1 EamA family transporter [Gammaproteobacteria bacterium]NIO64572.1 EamA family transporter [Gammaproteobacteria bacterium]
MLSSLRARFETFPDPVKAALLIVFAGLLFSSMNAMIRHASSELHPLQIVFFRSLFGFAAMIPWLSRQGIRALHTRRPGLIGLRTLLGFVSMATWFSALAVVPLGNAVALGFTAPLFAALAAVFVLREVIRARRITALAVGFGGMLVILRPGVETVGAGELMVIVSALTMALSVVTMKLLTRTEKVGSLVVYQTLLITPVALVPALLVWSWPSAAMWFWVVLIGIVASTAHMAFTRAFALADTMYLMPFDYLRLPQVAFLGWMLFGEPTDVYTWVGAAIIAASSLYVAHREAKVRAGH